MSYSWPRYNVRLPFAVPSEGLVSTGTFTASDHVATAANVDRGQFLRACKILGGRVFTVTSATSKVNKIVLMRGTNTVATATAAAANTGADFGAAANNSFTAGEEWGINIIHTGTASANQASSVVDIVLEYEEQFA